MNTKNARSTGKAKEANRFHLAQPGEQPGRRPAEPLSPEVRRRLSAAAREERDQSKESAGKINLLPGFKIAYSVREAAVAIGASEWYVRNEISLGMLAVSKPRGKLLIPRSELERYIEAYLQKTDAVSAAGNA